jgi:nucleotide-binding universal stress UspA family protein
MSGTQPSPCIVVGYDGSEPARAALRLAVDRVGTGKLLLVHGYRAPADFWAGGHDDQLQQAAFAHGEAVLHGAAAVEPRLGDVDHELELIDGRPAQAIIDVARTRDADEIIAGTRGSDPVRGSLGSVAHALLRNAACPVTVVPDAAVARLARAAGARAAAQR